MAGVNKTGFRVTGRVDVENVERYYNVKSRKAMVAATTFWKALTVRHAPVATGQTKQQIQQFVSFQSYGVIGGLVFGTHYSKYLIFGATSKGVLQQVENWKIGDPPITTWAAKSGKGPGVQGRKDVQGNANAQLPLALPYIEEALAVLREQMSG